MKRTLLLSLIALVFVAAVPAYAGSVTFTFTKPDNDKDTEVQITVKKSNGDLVDRTKVTIKPGMTAEEKRDAIQDALDAKGYTTTTSTSPPADPDLTISALRSSRKVTFWPGATGEKKDTEVVPRATIASIDFSDAVLNADWDEGAASFTAGIITAFGEASVEYVANDWAVGDVLPGDYLAERLFSDLQDAAADLGAFLELDGGSILVSFSEGAAEGGGVIFGSSSMSDAVSATSTIGGEDTDEAPVEEPFDG